MIQDVPAADDFKDGALAFFNLGWGLLVDILGEDAAREEGGPDQPPTYLKRKQRTLSTAALLLAQAVELALKAKVAEVSPFLLLDDPTKGPNRTFSDLLTVSASDLPKLCEAVCAERLSPQFGTRLTTARERRNKIAHSAPTKLTVTVKELVQDFFFFVDELYGEQSWKRFRRSWTLTEDDGLQVHPWAEYRFADEMETTLAFLAPAQARRHLGAFAKTKHRYCCPYCVDPEEGESQPKTAYMSDDRKCLDCFSCEKTAALPSGEPKCEVCLRTLLFPPKRGSPSPPSPIDFSWDERSKGPFFQLCIQCGC